MRDGSVGFTEVVDLENDDLLFIPITSRGNNKKDAISVENYKQDRGKAPLHGKSKRVIDLSLEEEDDGEVQEINVQPIRKKPFRYPSVTDTGESSNFKDTTFTCEICVDTKSQDQSFSINGCTHSYCSDCMAKYVGSKIQDNVITIKCPESNCSGVLELEFCRSILPKEVYDRWGNALWMAVKESECPHCRRMFCAQCKVPWHYGIGCEEFQKLKGGGESGKEDIMLMQLAKESNWQRCPKCNFFVERSTGCNVMRCSWNDQVYNHSCGGRVMEYPAYSVGFLSVTSVDLHLTGTNNTSPALGFAVLTNTDIWFVTAKTKNSALDMRKPEPFPKVTTNYKLRTPDRWNPEARPKVTTKHKLRTPDRRRAERFDMNTVQGQSHTQSFARNTNFGSLTGGSQSFARRLPHIINIGLRTSGSQSPAFTLTGAEETFDFQQARFPQNMNFRSRQVKSRAMPKGGCLPVSLPDHRRACSKENNEGKAGEVANSLCILKASNMGSSSQINHIGMR
ncbi:hypothetical protein IFM89_027420 [Coptis chinensis]|uniref:RBR-type E3 ubiquitin transferase n=1 Tax=Coptis chinensis TaxID=261450 RepID=A0A835ISZ4_9MAGN|nr:hypothetical protein IFM89_027420 [Coptis chinensis]